MQIDESEPKSNLSAILCLSLLSSSSYDMKIVTKEWSIAEKISTPVVGIEPGPPG